MDCQRTGYEKHHKNKLNQKTPEVRQKNRKTQENKTAQNKISWVSRKERKRKKY